MAQNRLGERPAHVAEVATGRVHRLQKKEPPLKGSFWQTLPQARQLRR